MMEINYSLLRREKKHESGEYVVKNAFYMRDERKRKTSRMYKGYHATDYYGSSFITDSDLAREKKGESSDLD